MALQIIRKWNNTVYCIFLKKACEGTATEKDSEDFYKNAEKFFGEHSELEKAKLEKIEDQNERKARIAEFQENNYFRNAVPNQREISGIINAYSILQTPGAKDDEVAEALSMACKIMDFRQLSLNNFLDVGSRIAILKMRPSETPPQHEEWQRQFIGVPREQNEVLVQNAEQIREHMLNCLEAPDENTKQAAIKTLDTLAQVNQGLLRNAKLPDTFFPIPLFLLDQPNARDYIEYYCDYMAGKHISSQLSGIIRKYLRILALGEREPFLNHISQRLSENMDVIQESAPETGSDRINTAPTVHPRAAGHTGGAQGRAPQSWSSDGEAINGFEPDQDMNQEPSYHEDETKYPPGSRTVAWGRKGFGKFYINRLGMSGAAIYRIQPNPIFSDSLPEGEQVDWDEPPEHLCCSSSNKRLGDKKTETGKHVYTRKHFKGIFGVAFNANATPFKNEPDYEAMNPTRYKSRKGAPKLRFPGCYVKVAWLRADGKTVMSWEVRDSLRVASRLKKDGADKAIYQAAKFERERYDAAVGREWIGISCQTPEPQDEALISPIMSLPQTISPVAVMSSPQKPPPVVMSLPQAHQKKIKVEPDEISQQKSAAQQMAILQQMMKLMAQLPEDFKLPANLGQANLV